MEPWLALLALIRLAPRGPAGQDPDDGPGASRRLPKRYLVLAAFAVVIAALVAAELRQSRLQAELFSLLAGKMAFRPTPGASSSMRAAPDGPYDHRLGYSRLPAILERLHAEGFETEAQAQWSPELTEWVDAGLFPIYEEKPQAGFTLLDRNGELLHRSPHPQRLYPTFAAIPQSVVESLLFIENRDMLDARYTTRNPAIEWDRLSKAGLDLGLRTVLPSHPVSGGSTLATQLEKLRHSEGGRTEGVGEKLRQIASASFRAYREGPQTLAAQQRIVADYINSIPLAAVAGHGEVIGLGEGLDAWYGADFDHVNRLLAADEATLSQAERVEQARVYRQALSLLLALRRPSHFLVDHPEDLVARTESYLRLLADRGVISTARRDLALAQTLTLQRYAPPPPLEPFVERKATDAVRARTAGLLGVSGFYELDRLDLVAESTLDAAATQQAVDFLTSLRDEAGIQAAGLSGRQLLQQQDPSQVIYSFTLYERGADANRLRVQADTWDGPFNVNDGTLLELGSTAKLRTLVSYLEVVAALHAKLAAEQSLSDDDPLTRWAADYWQGAENQSLESMLDAAMERRYSASPNETFFTGGGVHRFSNFDPRDNGSVMPVRHAFHNSVNLVFIRMMRDVVRYYAEQIVAEQPGLFDDPDAEARRTYLARFADIEGSQFLTDFYQKHTRLTPKESLESLAEQAGGSVIELSVLYRAVRPNDSQAALGRFLADHARRGAVAAKEVAELYEMYGPGKFSLEDQGYLADVHPLELWLVNYLAAHPYATLDETLAASAQQRQDVYGWLFRTRHPSAQDKRIRIVVEIDAFQQIHRTWQRLGYPFDSLTPSYATAIGSSGDRPEALAELVGIIVNDGVRKPLIRVDALRFAEGTPYETRLRRKLDGLSERVMPRAVAKTLRRELIGVVAEGTGRRANGAVPDRDGQPLPIGGKTGTGDNRVVTYASNGRAIQTRP
ncbi:MAG: transglycosylase domain-containing protein, partial [Acidobacteria bacterium]|nr:transglycosylase domain-containing protein [Acidobacteriota bacterium]